MICKTLSYDVISYEMTMNVYGKIPFSSRSNPSIILYYHHFFNTRSSLQFNRIPDAKTAKLYVWASWCKNKAYGCAQHDV